MLLLPLLQRVVRGGAVAGLRVARQATLPRRSGGRAVASRSLSRAVPPPSPSPSPPLGWYDAHVFGGNWEHARTVRKPCADGKAEMPDRLVHEADGARVLVFNDRLEALLVHGGPDSEAEGSGGGDSSSNSSTLVHPNFLLGRADACRDADTVLYLGTDPDGREYVAVQLASSSTAASPTTGRSAAAGGEDDDDGVGGRAGLLPVGGKFVPLRTAAIMLRSGETTARDLALAGQARNVLLWHATARFCGRCGEPTHTAQDAWKRVCCSCGAEHFPRTDLVAITAVSSPDGQRCLLGRQKAWPPGLFSCLAGFLEPGESLAEGVAREVLEESGVQLAGVALHSTQPWPCGPSPQLMMGCLSVAAAEDDLQVNKDELDDARWFSRDEVLEALERCQTEVGMKEYLRLRTGADHERLYTTPDANTQATHSAGEPNLLVPPPTAIAHHLIRAWADGQQLPGQTPSPL